MTQTGSNDNRRLDRLDQRALEILFTEARTANTFADTPVTDAELTEIWELARWAPTSANTQPLRVLYLRQGDSRERLVKHMNEGNRAKTLSAPGVAVLARDTRFHEHIPAVLPYKPQLKDVFDADDTKRQDTATFNATLQAGYFILAVRARGLAAGPMGGFDAAGIDAEFFPGGRFRSILVVNIGHPGKDPWYARLPRLDHADVVRWA
ncbi:malonic semialdehyde reductase [Micromonospora sp. WMMD1155]|uniref:malonic semialdehyde reductase n=1 Tax=Micromonospora sp. WMMD1155 TaxID=3016094 RepID=UPI00249ACB85|nr:malonic semialdehyde reductase [Micromonospora sp. WMMD1155]WFE53185.1 malonic semialdehyde reductase [Micromonospora sp. WMMD1155]